jgi:hypothetical protein
VYLLILYQRENNMYALKKIATLICITLTSAGIASGASLEKRHQLGLDIGMWHQVADVRASVSPGSVYTSVGSNGFLGGVHYGYWLTEGLALNIGVGVMAADVETKVELLEVSSGTAAVTQFLVGARAYFPKSTYGSSVRPYVSTGVGAFYGSHESTRTGLVVVTETRTATAFGGQAGVGADFIMGKHFLTGISLGYNLMSDFDKSIGGSDNYSGPEFSAGFSYLFGRGTK